MTDQREDQAMAEVEGFGIRAKVAGNRVLSRDLYLAALIFAAAALVMWEKNTANASFMEQHKTTQRALATVLVGQENLIKELHAVAAEVKSGNQIQAYVMTLTQQQRERLNLSMPDELRHRIRNGSQ